MVTCYMGLLFDYYSIKLNCFCFCCGRARAIHMERLCLSNASHIVLDKSQFVLARDRFCNVKEKKSKRVVQENVVFSGFVH